MNQKRAQSGIISGPASVSGCFIWAQGAVSGDGPAASFEPISTLHLFCWEVNTQRTIRDYDVFGIQEKIKE